MKKRVLSLIAVFAMAATMLSSFAIVHADVKPTLKVVTDAEDITNIKEGDTFNVSVVLDNFDDLVKYDSKKKSGVGITSLQFVLYMPENEYVASGSETVCAGATSNWIEQDGAWLLSVAFAGQAGSSISSVPYTLATVDFTANKDITEAQVFEILDTEIAEVTKQVVTSGAITDTTNYSLEKGSLATEKLTIGAPAEDKVDTTYEGTTQAEGTGDQAKAFRRTEAIQTGKTPYWQATIDGKTMYCKAITGANLSGNGNVKLGLVYLGEESISNVTLYWN